MSHYEKVWNIIILPSQGRPIAPATYRRKLDAAKHASMLASKWADRAAKKAWIEPHEHDRLRALIKAGKHIDAMRFHNSLQDNQPESFWLYLSLSTIREKP